ncbi:DUF3179 domain-containing protein [Candidatus Parcubacteria bacterium]|jgi:hypothetical protein|nr:DUF3179 domain-containing protein [Candidatus Parcubacteria bacterium]
MGNKNFLILGIFLVVALIIFFSNSPEEVIDKIAGKKLPGFDTDTTKTSIDIDLILSGGPGKDDIPALSNPKFTSIEGASLKDKAFGVLVNMDGEKRYYPYNIMVWHEIVNDSIGDNDFAVTFCPLCGSAIVIDRNVGGQILDFGVSGYLYESNLLMYDRQTESLWSQARGEAVVGDYVGSKLQVLDMQLISFLELKQKHNDALVLSQDTGHSRDYSFYPYDNYESSDNLYFPVSVSDNRFSAKEVMYSFSLDDQYISFPQEGLQENGVETLNLNGYSVSAQRDGDEIVVINNGQKVPGYYEMWFSWATHHQNDGIVWEMNE